MEKNIKRFFSSVTRAKKLLLLLCKIYKLDNSISHTFAMSARCHKVIN
jgi:hypothetical protein